MRTVIAPPLSAVDPVVDILHGVEVTDPYRWLEDQNSPRTRTWIEEQSRYARAYLDSLPGRERIRERVRELLDVETYDSFLRARNRYFFRKRLKGQEQPSIYFREGADGEDELLVDPAERGSGDYTAVKPLRASADGTLLLFEVKQGGERMGRFEILDVASRRTLPDMLPRGYLRGFAFAPDEKSFYYVHEAAETARPFYRAAFHHVLGTDFRADKEIFLAGEDERLRLMLVAGIKTLGFLVYRFAEKTYTDFYIWGMGSAIQPVLIVRNADYSFAPRLVPGRIFAAIDHRAPNRRIVEVQGRNNEDPLYFDLVRETDALIQNWTLTANLIVVSYVRGTRSQIVVFDHSGKPVGEIPVGAGETVRVAARSLNVDEILLERESFTEPRRVERYAPAEGAASPWSGPSARFDSSAFTCQEFSFPAIDGTRIPLSLVGRKELLTAGTNPMAMTSYGGFGVPMTPQFSVLVSVLLECGCLFALPNIRGGSEFGHIWHEAAKRRNRQVAIDDFLFAAEWLIETERTAPDKLAVFGGSNSGLLVAAAMTQRPALFRAVLSIAPMLDMLRYHLFDNAHVWKEEFGTAENREDFTILASYSPYHAIREGTAYPSTMIVSGDRDQNCNALHARKMTAGLQAANKPGRLVLLDYSRERGHSPVLPLSTRIEALTDRLSFLCDQLQLAV